MGIEYGANDFFLCVPIDDFKKSLNYSVKNLLTSLPQLHLFLTTPTWRLNFEELDSNTHPNKNGVFLKEYVDAVIEVATSNHIACLDMWRVLGLNASNYKNFTADGLHPNEAGARIRGEVIASFMKETFYISS